MTLSALTENKLLRMIAGVLLAFFLLYLGVGFYIKAFYGFAWDYSINWIAAKALQEGVPLYDRDAMHQLALKEIGTGAQALFNGRFTSFVGLPTTAMAHLPFSSQPYDTSVVLYRALSLGAMLLTLFLTGLVVQKDSRLRVWLVGVLCLLLWHGFSFSIKLGQVDAWVMLSLAVTIFAASRGAQKTAGAALAVAVLLKISPGWLLLYCMAKRQWVLVISACTVIAAGLLLSLLPQSGMDLQQFLSVVLPELGDSPRHVQNQALGAWLARLVTPDTQLLSFAVGIGAWKFIGAGVSAGLLFALCRQRPGQSLQVEELATAILLALLAGPLTWDHYLTWALVPVMLLCARLSLSGMLLLGVLLTPLLFPVVYAKPDMVAMNWWWRILTGVQVITLCMLAIWMINNCGVRTALLLEARHKN